MGRNMFLTFAEVLNIENAEKQCFSPYESV
jgi:hypothetical protein